MTVSDDRAEQVRKLTLEIWGVHDAEKLAAKLYDQGWRHIPAPPEPRNPISRETALASLHEERLAELGPNRPNVCGPFIWTEHQIEQRRGVLWAIRERYVRDLAEAAKDSEGFVRIMAAGQVYYHTPERIVDALAGPTPGGPER